MDVLVAGGHGKIAQHLLRLLAERGHHGRGLIRNPDHAADLERLGAVPVLCDLETDDVRPHLGGAEAIVFAAGAGPGSGPERKRTVDYGGAVKLIEAAEELGVRRYVIVSSIGAGDPDVGPEPMRPYLRAKADADAALRDSTLDWTIVRPGSLTDVPGTGLVEVVPSGGRRGDVPREDVALTVLECLGEPLTIGKTFDLLEGETPVVEALEAGRWAVGAIAAAAGCGRGAAWWGWVWGGAFRGTSGCDPVLTQSTPFSGPTPISSGPFAQPGGAGSPP